MKPVLITTKHRGVFFGHLEKDPENLPGSVDLVGARGCISWSSDVKGFLGLASTGPSSDCRIGPKVEEITLYDVTAVVTCSKVAVAKWEEAPWR